MTLRSRCFGIRRSRIHSGAALAYLAGGRPFRPSLFRRLVSCNTQIPSCFPLRHISSHYRLRRSDFDKTFGPLARCSPTAFPGLEDVYKRRHYGLDSEALLYHKHELSRIASSTLTREQADDTPQRNVFRAARHTGRITAKDLKHLSSMAARTQNTNAPGERQKFYFQFVTTPTADTPGTTLLLHFDNQRYFFGRIAEGTQRACIQRGVGIKKVRNLFLTGPTTWHNMGGLIGMILTMADVQYEEMDSTTGKRPKLRIQGGPKLMHSIACARRFVFRTGMPLQICEADLHSNINQPTYIDANIDVWSIPIKRRGQSGITSPILPNGRSQSPTTLAREQTLRADTIKNMFDSDWRKDRLVESRFDEVKLPALIWVRDPVTKELNGTQCVTMADAPQLQPDSRVLVRNPWPASLVEELPKVDNIAGSVAMSYIVRGKAQRGKFLPQKAKELGVKPGPDYSALTFGASVTLADGTIITSDMVLGKTEPGKGMAIFDIPSEDYLEDLSEQIEGLASSVMEGVEAVSWLLGNGVVSNPAFVQILESLPHLQHIISSPDISPNYLALDSAAASSIRLAQIRPECFKLPIHNNDTPSNYSLPQSLAYTQAERGLIIQVAPKSFISRSEVPPFLDVESTKASYGDILSNLVPALRPSNEVASVHDDVQILTLGTGSAVPSKYRNVSGTLVRVPDHGSHLFDCGENTLGTLKRIYTGAELDEVLADLRMIWISHLHADHHLGTLSIIEAKKKAVQRLDRTEPKLYIVSEPNMADYLNDYASVQSSSHCQLLGVLNSAFQTKNESAPSTAIEILQTSLPIKEFLTTRVSHCHGAQACSVTFSNGFKFSYSGDCRPSAQFAKIGQNSDVLLHEATFDDGLEGDAMAKKHSTTAEALAVAHAMKAKNVILTHFSQRYQKIPMLSNVKFGEVKFEEGEDDGEAGPIEDGTPTQTLDRVRDQQTIPEVSSNASEFESADSITTMQQVARDMHVCVAFDMMSVTVGQIRDMYKYYPAVEKMFELEQEKSEAKKEQRREALEQLIQAKELKENKGKASGSKHVKPAEPKGGDVYERINRNKSKENRQANGSAARANTDVSANNSTGNSNALLAQSQPPLSNRAMKRLLKKAESAQHRHQTQDAMAESLFATARAIQENRSTRQLSTEPDPRETKRVKLDDQGLAEPEGQS